MVSMVEHHRSLECREGGELSPSGGRFAGPSPSLDRRSASTPSPTMDPQQGDCERRELSPRQVEASLTKGQEPERGLTHVFTTSI